MNDGIVIIIIIIIIIIYLHKWIYVLSSTVPYLSPLLLVPTATDRAVCMRGATEHYRIGQTNVTSRLGLV